MNGHCTKNDLFIFTDLVTFTEEILNGKLNFFVQWGMPLMSCKGQRCDGASNMVVANTGVAIRIMRSWNRNNK